MRYIRWNYGPGSATMHADECMHGRYPNLASLLAYLWDRAERGLIVNILQDED